MGFFRDLGRAISKPFEEIGDFFVPDLPEVEDVVEEGESAEEMARTEGEAAGMARAQAMEADARRRQRQEMFAGTRTLTGGRRRQSPMTSGAAMMSGMGSI